MSWANAAAQLLGKSSVNEVLRRPTVNQYANRVSLDHGLQTEHGGPSEVNGFEVGHHASGGGRRTESLEGRQGTSPQVWGLLCLEGRERRGWEGPTGAGLRSHDMIQRQRNPI